MRPTLSEASKSSRSSPQPANQGYTLLAACAFGLEAVVRRELESLGYSARVASPGRVEFQGDLSAVCRANLWLRTADRVLVQVGAFAAGDFDQLFETTQTLAWEEWIGPDAEFPVNAKSIKSTLTSVPAIQRSVKRAVVERLLRAHDVQVLPETGPKYGIEVSLLEDRATVTLDTTGASLHKRGYRKLVGQAPLKETLAAAMIQLSVWNPDRPLIDPFCGTGTIPIEAALIGRNIAPGIERSFSAQAWPRIDADLWRRASEEARDLAKREGQLQIVGTDIDSDSIDLARNHAQRAGVADDVHLQQQPFEELRSRRLHGCVITNPPYGLRLQDEVQVERLYRQAPGVLQRLPTWSHFILTAAPHFERVVQRQATRRRKLYNGRIECTYYQFLGPRPPRAGQRGVLAPESSSEETISPEMDKAGCDESVTARLATEKKRQSAQGSASAVSVRTEQPDQPVFGRLDAKAEEQAALFASRLAKRARHLRRWPVSRGITCFRLYERDIPEIPLVVDRYEDWLHITEYERPHTRDLGQHAAWLELMKKTAGQTLSVPIQRVVLKSRSRLHDRRQYEKQADTGRLIEVREGGLRFLVNFTDYVDTGLFLDHRQTRAMVRDEASGRHVLNLFAYSGAFTVYAAAGGAESTTTVDASNTYLDWARRNMKLNEFDSPEHSFVRDDVLAFVRRLEQKPQFDLAIVDPPTFSNSTDRTRDWDVQRDHAQLINELVARLSPGGVIYFSTNFRRFRLEEQPIAGVTFREISRQTVPPDFRNRRIHRCWRLLVQ